ncbi:MAG: hypothetical protein LBC19_06425 [Tannerella sp.]|jgi:hypothetical protein|nr:hypothetical protein [Tannerella sp.]
MNYRKSRIEYYRERTFSEKLNVTFDFIRENWKPLLKYTFYLIMPVCLIQTFAMNSFISAGFSSAGSGGASSFGRMAGSSAVTFFVNYGVILFCSLIGAAIISGMVYAMMQAYATREDGLGHVTLNDFKENLVRNIWKCLRISLFFILICIVITGIAAILAVLVSAVSLFITIPILIIALLLLIPFMMLMPVYIFEHDIRFPDAITKAWKLGTETLWGMLGLFIVLSIVSSVVQTLTTLPWYIVTLFGHVLSLTAESTLNQSAIYKFAVFILGLIQTYGAYAASTVGLIGLAFHYFHAREKAEGVTIESNISNFNRL